MHFFQSTHVSLAAFLPVVGPDPFSQAVFGAMTTSLMGWHIGAEGGWRVSLRGSQGLRPAGALLWAFVSSQELCLPRRAALQKDFLRHSVGCRGLAKRYGLGIQDGRMVASLAL